MSPQMTLTLMTPVSEDKSFLLKDTHLPQMMEDMDHIKKEDDDDDDDFSSDSWETASNDELEQVMKFSKELLSPDITRNVSLDWEEKAKKESKKINESFLNFKSTGSFKMLQIIEKTKKEPFIEDTEETRTMKREKNRLAARRCRQKQKDRIDYLEQDVKEIERANYKVENEIKHLQIQLKELRDLLVNHDCVMKIPKLSHYSTKYSIMNNYPLNW